MIRVWGGGLARSGEEEEEGGLSGLSGRGRTPDTTIRVWGGGLVRSGEEEEEEKEEEQEEVGRLGGGGG